MPRPKKQIAEEIVEPVIRETPVAAFYMGMQATILKTHEDGHIDLTVSYDGVNQVPKLRVSPESVEYKNAP